MPNFRVMTSLLGYTPSATSADANWPVTNLALYLRLTKKWAATVATGVVDVTFDLGSGNTLSGLAADPGIFIDDVNVTAIKIQANSSSSWGTPPWDQAVTIGKDDWVQRRKGFWRFADLNVDAVAYRYVNVRILSQTPTDAANYRISRVALGQITELLINPLYDPERSFVDPSIKTEMFDGGEEHNSMGPRRFEAQYKRQLFGEAELAQELAIQAITPGTPFVIWDSSRTSSQYAWMVRRTQEPAYRESFMEQHEGAIWSVREAI